MKEKNFIDRISAKWLVYTALTLVLIAPLFLVYIPSIIDFRNTGQIGDTIGGITAPIIGLVSALLLYKSFRAQIDANNQSKEESNFFYLNAEFESVKKSTIEYIDNFKFQIWEKDEMAIKKFKQRIESYISTYQSGIDLKPHDGTFETLNPGLKSAHRIISLNSSFLRELENLNLSDKYYSILQSRYLVLYYEIQDSVLNIFNELPDDFQPDYTRENYNKPMVDLAAKVSICISNYNSITSTINAWISWAEKKATQEFQKNSK